MNAIDLSPLAVQLIELIGVVISGLLAWILFKVRKYIGDKNSELLALRVEKAIKWGISYGVNYIEKEKPTVNVKESITALAVQYVIDAVPDALKYFNITQEGIAKRIEARLGLIDITDGGEAPTTGARAVVTQRNLFD
jgi:hypothetical protein